MGLVEWFVAVYGGMALLLAGRAALNGHDAVTVTFMFILCLLLGPIGWLIAWFVGKDENRAFAKRAWDDNYRRTGSVKAADRAYDAALADIREREAKRQAEERNVADGRRRSKRR